MLSQKVNAHLFRWAITLCLKAYLSILSYVSRQKLALKDKPHISVTIPALFSVDSEVKKTVYSLWKHICTSFPTCSSGGFGSKWYLPLEDLEEMRLSCIFTQICCSRLIVQFVGWTKKKAWRSPSKRLHCPQHSFPN